MEEQETQMNLIHCKIQEEAEKLRKWQTSSEIELKQKISKLRECESIINKQRSQILEIQVENETLSSSLQKEQQNQIQINLKLKTTRDLFLALKNHYENLQSSIIRGEEDRDSLRMLEAENIRQLKDMKSKMQEVIGNNDKKVSFLKSSLKEKELTIDEFKSKCDNELANAKKAQNSLEEEVANCKRETENVSKLLLEKKNEIFILEEKISSLENSLQKSSKLIADKEYMMSDMQQQLDSDLQSREKLEAELQKQISELSRSKTEREKYREEANSQIDELQSELSELTESLTELSTRYNELSSKHDRLETENFSLKDSIGQLVKCVEELQQKQEQNEQELSNLTNLNNKAKEKEAELTALISQKDSEVSEIASEKEKLEVEFKKVSHDFENLKLRESSYLKEIDKLTESNHRAANDYNELDQKLLDVSNGLDSQVKELRCNLEAKQLAFSELEEKYVSIKSNHRSLVSSLEFKDENLQQLMREKLLLKKEISSYLQQVKGFEDQHLLIATNITEIETNFLNFCNELECSRKSIENHKNKLNIRDAEVVRLSTSVKSLQKKCNEMQSVYDSAAQKGCVLEKENMELNKAINSHKMHCEELEEQVSDLRNQLSSCKESLKCLVNKNEVNEKAQIKNLKESLNEALLNNGQLEKQKQELNKTINGKNIDISALAEELTKTQSKVKDLEKASISKSEFSDLECRNLALIEEKKSLTTDITKLSEEIRLSKLNYTSLVAEKDALQTQLTNSLSQNETSLQSVKSLEEENKNLITDVEKQKLQIETLAASSNKLTEKVETLSLVKQEIEKIKSDFSSSEKEYIATIERLKTEINTLNKDKVQTLLSHATHSTSTVTHTSPKTPRKHVIHPESPKTPSTATSKKRRVVFGKSPSWKTEHFSDDDENTILTPKIKYISKKSVLSPNIARSSSKSPKKSVNELLKLYPKPDSTHVRGTRLPESYLKRKKERREKKSKIKIESCSWFDNDNVFGFDEK